MAEDDQNETRRLSDPVVAYGQKSDLVLRYIATSEGFATDDLERLAPFAASPDVKAAMRLALRTAQAAVDATSSWHRTGNPMSKAHRAKVAAQTAAAAKTLDASLQELIGDMAEVLALSGWVKQPALIENALAPLVAIRPGWLEEAGL